MMAYLWEWMRLWNGSLDNIQTPADPPNLKPWHWWCDWVNRVGIYGYDPVKVFPWRRTKRQWLHDTGWFGFYDNPDSIPWDGIGYPQRK